MGARIRGVEHHFIGCDRYRGIGAFFPSNPTFTITADVRKTVILVSAFKHHTATPQELKPTFSTRANTLMISPLRTGLEKSKASKVRVTNSVPGNVNEAALNAMSSA